MIIFTIQCSVVEISARTIYGELDIVDSQYIIRTESSIYKLIINNPNLMESFSHLKIKDYVSLDGDTKLLERRKFQSIFSQTVTDINYVGLSDLIGLWKDKAGLCYHFVGYNKFYTFIPTINSPCYTRSARRAPESRFSQFQYIIVPAQSTFIATIINMTDQNQFVAEIKSYSKVAIELELFNNNSDQKSSLVHLVRQ